MNLEITKDIAAKTNYLFSVPARAKIYEVDLEYYLWLIKQILPFLNACW